MNQIPDALEALAKREQELYAVLLSAAEQLARREQSVRTALDDLSTRVNAVQAGQKKNSEAAVEKAVAISNEYSRYQDLVSRVRQAVSRRLPPDATVIVVSKGDNELLKLEGRNAWHFPQNEWGVYAGHYPGDSAEAIAHLEALRKKGGQYLVFPQTALWWLDHYGQFKQHLDKRYTVMSGPEEPCVIYCLRQAVTRETFKKRGRVARKRLDQKRRASSARAQVTRRLKNKR